MNVCTYMVDYNIYTVCVLFMNTVNKMALLVKFNIGH